MRLAFLASNNGSGMRAVVAAAKAGRLDCTPVLLVTNRPGAPALVFARDEGIATEVVPTMPDPAAADERLAGVLVDSAPDLVVLSGYLRRLGPAVLAAFAGKMLNIHPALLPKFGGAGMYGRRVHEAVAAAGETESGASLHLVDAEYDHGPVIAQRRVRLPPGATAEQIEALVTAIEPELMVETLRRISTGELRLPST